MYRATRSKTRGNKQEEDEIRVVGEDSQDVMEIQSFEVEGGGIDVNAGGEQLLNENENIQNTGKPIILEKISYVERKSEKTDMENILQAILTKMDHDKKEILNKMCQDKEEVKVTIKNNKEEVKEIIQNNKEAIESKIEEIRGDLSQELKLMDERLQQGQNYVHQEAIKLVDIEKHEREMENKKMYEKIDRVYTEIKEKTLDIEDSVDTMLKGFKEVGQDWHDEMDACKEETKKNIEDIRKELKDKLTNVQVEGISKLTSVTNHNLELNIKFDGNFQNLHPRAFVETLKNRIKHINNFQDVKDIIRANLIETPLVWFNSQEYTMQKFKDFEEKFLQYFWGEVSQADFRETLYFGKFDYNQSSDLVSYALRLFSIAQHLEPPIREEEIILNIARHYKTDVVESTTVHNIKTFEQFINFITRIQRGSANNGQYNRSMYYNNNNDRNNHYNPHNANKNYNNNRGGYYNNNFNRNNDNGNRRFNSYQNNNNYNSNFRQNNFRQNNNNYRNYNNNYSNNNYQNRYRNYNANNNYNNYRQNQNNNDNTNNRTNYNRNNNQNGQGQDNGNTKTLNHIRRQYSNEELRQEREQDENRSSSCSRQENGQKQNPQQNENNNNNNNNNNQQNF
jgi:hypothetical protein